MTSVARPAFESCPGNAPVADRVSLGKRMLFPRVSMRVSLRREQPFQREEPTGGPASL